MNEKEIKDRLDEISKLHDPLYKEEFKLKEELDKLYFEKFKLFLQGKAFKVKLSKDLSSIYLYCNKYSPSTLFKNGVDEYHTSFYDGNIRIYCDDGDITIACENSQELLSYAKNLNIDIDFSEIRKQEDDLVNLINFLKGMN